MSPLHRSRALCILSVIFALALNSSFGFVTVEIVWQKKGPQIQPIAPHNNKQLQDLPRRDLGIAASGCQWNELRVQGLPHVPATKAPVQFYELYTSDSGKTVIDVGANDGAGIKEALMNGHTVLAFEPVPSLCRLLNSHFKQNNKFHLKCAVASNSSGLRTLHQSLAAGSASSTLSQGVIQGLSIASKPISVQSVTVDQFIDHINSTILVFKSDTQGHELAVLQGAEQVVRKGRVSYFYVEFDPYLLAQSGTEALDLLRWFHELGYACRYARQRKCKTYDNGPLRHKCWTDLLCAPVSHFLGQPTHCIPYDVKDFIGEAAGTALWPF